MRQLSRVASTGSSLMPWMKLDCRRRSGPASRKSARGRSSEKHDARLDPGQASPEAEVLADAEPEMGIGVAFDVELVRPDEDVLVAVGRAVEHGDELTRPEPLAAQLRIADDRAEHRVDR